MPLDHVAPDHGLVVTDLTDDELTAIALAADPEAPLAPDARPVELPEWALPRSYMAPVAPGVYRLSRVRQIAVYVVIAMFLVTAALGFCATYGVLSFA